MRAPRASANSRSSRTRIAAPSPSTKPSRSQVERPARAFGLVVAARERFHRIEAAHRGRHHRRFAAAGHDRDRLTERDLVVRNRQRIVGTRTRAGHRKRRTAQAVHHRNVRGGGVGHQHRDEERGNAIPGVIRRDGEDGVFDRDDAADAAGDDRPGARAHVRILRKVRVGQRFGGRDRRKVRVAVHPARFLAPEQRIGIEVFDLGGDVRVQLRRVVRGDEGDAAPSGDEGLPKSVPRVAQGRDRPDPGNDNSPLLQNVLGYDDPPPGPCPRRSGNRPPRVE